MIRRWRERRAVKRELAYRIDIYYPVDLPEHMRYHFFLACHDWAQHTQARFTPPPRE